MRAEQTVSEMAQVVLSRQASSHAQRTGEPLDEALEAVLETPAGMQLEERGGTNVTNLSFYELRLLGR